MLHCQSDLKSFLFLFFILKKKGLIFQELIIYIYINNECDLRDTKHCKFRFEGYFCVVYSINTHLKVLHYNIFIQVMLYIHHTLILSHFVGVAFSISL
jgi:hypothetical protein